MNGAASAAVAGYVALRRSLGYRSAVRERSLRAFCRYLDSHGHQGPILLETSLAWATSTTATDPHNPARRLAAVRSFLRYLAGLDGQTEVPAAGLLGPVGHRSSPHIYSDTEIADLIAGAAQLAPAGGLRPLAYATLFGLIACTGLRIGEALGLTCGDADLTYGVLTVHGKRGLTRLVPLHPSALAPLLAYAEQRDRRYRRPADDGAFFRTDISDRISHSAAHHAFTTIRRKLGWTAAGRTRQPRIHDLRHAMAVRRIQTWHAEGVDVDARLPVLATYLGHVEIRELYWYLSAVPELMSIIGVRFEAFAARSPAGA